MKKCSSCGSLNGDHAKFCNECATALSPVPGAVRGGTIAAPPLGLTRSADAAELARSIAAKTAGGRLSRRADILFVLDCTGSMGGEIAAMKDCILLFADSIETEGVRARVGLIEFRDRLNGEEHRVLLFDGSPFTTDPAAFRSQVSRLTAKGGGDEPESSLDAIVLAAQQPFAPESAKVIVLVTDAPPHIPDKTTRTVEEASEAIRKAGIQQLYLVIRTQDSSSQIYLKLLAGTRGQAFDLGKGDDFRKRAEDFKRTLMAMGKTISQATR